MSQHFRLIDDQEHAIASGESALVLANALGDFALQVETNFRLGRAYDSLGEFRRAVDFFRWNVEFLVGDQLQKRFGQPGLPSVLSRGLAGLMSRGAGGISRGCQARPGSTAHC